MYTLKTIAFDTGRRKFISPTHREFEWEPGIVWAACDTCNKKGGMQVECTCGIYTSPNPEALLEYETFFTSIIVLVKMYGLTDIWFGPEDLIWTRAVRSEGIRIVGVLGSGSLTNVGFLEGSRGLAEAKALEYFHCSLYPWPLVRKMIQIEWAKEPIEIDPYSDPRCK